MSTTHNSAAEREAFEAWRRRSTRMNPDDAVALDGFGDDAGYANKITRVMHIAWMARAALQSPAVQPVAVQEAASVKQRLMKMAREVDGLNWGDRKCIGEAIALIDRASPAPAAPTEQAAPQAEADIINAVIRDCAELDNAPTDDDIGDMLIVSPDDLRLILQRHIEGKE